MLVGCYRFLVRNLCFGPLLRNCYQPGPVWAPQRRGKPWICAIVSNSFRTAGVAACSMALLTARRVRAVSR